MAQHGIFTRKTYVRVYFAHSHSRWEGGIHEKTNDLLRQYLPKGQKLAWSLHVRPRKSVGRKAPQKFFLPEGAFDFVKHWSATINPVVLGASIQADSLRE